MTDRNEETGSYRTLSEAELSAVAGRGARTAEPAAKPSSAGVFEVKDYSFDIEQVLNIGS